MLGKTNGSTILMLRVNGNGHIPLSHLSSFSLNKIQSSYIIYV